MGAAALPFFGSVSRRLSRRSAAVSAARRHRSARITRDIAVTRYLAPDICRRLGDTKRQAPPPPVGGFQSTRVHQRDSGA